MRSVLAPLVALVLAQPVEAAFQPSLEAEATFTAPSGSIELDIDLRGEPGALELGVAPVEEGARCGGTARVRLEGDADDLSLEPAAADCTGAGVPSVTDAVLVFGALYPLDADLSSAGEEERCTEDRFEPGTRVCSRRVGTAVQYRAEHLTVLADRWVMAKGRRVPESITVSRADGTSGTLTLRYQ